jgi:hypothetical protein
LTVGACIVVSLVALTGGVLSAGRATTFGVLPDDSVQIRDLGSQVRAHAADRGPYLLDVAGGRAFNSLGYGVMWDLVRHGYDIRVLGGDVYLGSAHGLPRRAKVPHLLVVSSAPGFHAPAHARRVAVVGPDERALAERLRGEEAALVAGLETHGAQLTDSGRRLAAQLHAGELHDALSSLSEPSPPWHRLLHDHALVALVKGRFVSVSPGASEALVRFERLLNDSADAILSVFVVPPPT